jgi:membrane-bound lytic murein transglycosylase D
VTIADRFNVSVEDLRRWNHLSSTAIQPHRTLDVQEPVHLAPVAHVRAKPAPPTPGAKTKNAASAKAPAKASASKAGVKKTAATKPLKAPQ